MSNGGRGSQEYNMFPVGKSYLFSYRVVAGALLLAVVHVVHAIFSFQSKLSTASNIDVQLLLTGCMMPT